MESNIPYQPINENYKNNLASINKNFSDVVKHHMKNKNMTQADLCNKSNLSKTTVSRICRNSNDKGSSYVPTRQAFMAVSIGLDLNRIEATELYYTAFPEMALMDIFIDNRMSIMEANEMLYDYGLPLLGDMKEE